MRRTVRKLLLCSKRNDTEVRRAQSGQLGCPIPPLPPPLRFRNSSPEHKLKYWTQVGSGALLGHVRRTLDRTASTTSHPDVSNIVLKRRISAWTVELLHEKILLVLISRRNPKPRRPIRFGRSLASPSYSFLTLYLYLFGREVVQARS